jgi:hypothetical protein
MKGAFLERAGASLAPLSTTRRDSSFDDLTALGRMIGDAVP